MKEYNFPIKVPAIQVIQPMGVFYSVCLDAEFLVSVAYSSAAKIIEAKEGGYRFSGGQRAKRDDRLKEISRYIDSAQAAFPNSIILGANVGEDGTYEENESVRWRVEDCDIPGFYYLIIPSEKKLASIIDGQHRLFSFDKSSRKTMPVLCSVYLDLPVPYHAFIFATININQKKVDRSLAYELFGFNLEEEDPQYWSPETFAVYVSRVLNTETKSPLYGNILVGVQDLKEYVHKGEWFISTATIVDGILSLISSNPKRDRDIIGKSTLFGTKKRSSLSDIESQPLRKFYVNENDYEIYSLLSRYFAAIKSILYVNLTARSYIRKTVGIQALFDTLKIILNENKPIDDLEVFSVDFFSSIFEKIQSVDFSDPFFQASGKGRVRIKNVILVGSHLRKFNEMKVSDGSEKEEYTSLFNRYEVNIVFE